MASYTLTMRIDADNDVTPDQIRNAIYDACEDVPFGFDITEINKLSDEEGETPLQSDTCKECGHTRSLHYGPPRIGENRTGCTGPFMAECESRCAAFTEPPA